MKAVLVAAGHVWSRGTLLYDCTEFRGREWPSWDNGRVRRIPREDRPIATISWTQEDHVMLYVGIDQRHKQLTVSIREVWDKGRHGRAGKVRPTETRPTAVVGRRSPRGSHAPQGP